jgi:saccharopine dehydrogenase (NADP+, L-glutamate forming)
MKKILVLGAGMVAGAHTRYLLEQPDFHVTVASRTVSKAQAVVEGYPNGEARQLNVKDKAALGDLISQADLAVSLLPYAYHPTVARLCIKHRKHMVTTSYVKKAMAQLDGAAKEAGVILLNETGVDPGIDHMAAMKIIHQVQGDGGEITGFTSWCGGLPAPEANTNPYGYKFSWSPRGVLLASKNSARFLKDGEEVVIPGEELFDHCWPVPVEVEERVIEFEGYPNRDSLPYMKTYGITTAKNMFRGTLRNVGWCETMRKIVDLGFIDTEVYDDIAGLSFAQFTSKLIGSGVSSDPDDLKKDLAAYLDIEVDSQVMDRLEWLGLLSDDPLPLKKGAPIDILTARMLEKMQYEEGERDMIILQHEFVAEYPDHKQNITATLVDFGIPHGDTSMARTVGLPAAICARMILQGEIALTGVHTPVIPEIYKPALEELEQLDIRFTETWETVEK